MSARRVSRLGIVATAFVALVAVGVALAGPTHAQAATTTEACANPDCHSWGPGPDPSTVVVSPSPTPVTDLVSAPVAAPASPSSGVGLSRPSTVGHLRASKRFIIKGVLGAAHAETSTVTLELSRKVGSRYRISKRVVATIAPGASSYRASLKLARAGKWRVRAVHSDAAHVRTVSSYRAFALR